MSSWVCTACCKRKLGEKFEQKTIGGGGPRTCVLCGVVRERMDRMHYVTLPDHPRA